MVVPSPSCPNEFEPQQRIDPSSSSVQVWYDPAEISIAFLPIGIEAFCGSRLESLVPSPSCPLSFIPQQLTEPSSGMAHSGKHPKTPLSELGRYDRLLPTDKPDRGHSVLVVVLANWAGSAFGSSEPGDVVTWPGLFAGGLP